MKHLGNNVMTETVCHISVVMLNVNGLHSTVKRYRLEEWIQKITNQAPAIFKRLTCHIKTHIDSGERSGKRHSIQMETKNKQKWLFLYQMK